MTLKVCVCVYVCVFWFWSEQANLSPRKMSGLGHQRLFRQPFLQLLWWHHVVSRSQITQHIHEASTVYNSIFSWSGNLSNEHTAYLIQINTNQIYIIKSNQIRSMFLQNCRAGPEFWPLFLDPFPAKSQEFNQKLNGQNKITTEPEENGRV